MSDKEIRTILAPLTEGFLLLPNSAVAEVLEYTAPVPFKEAPAWLLGELAWRGWQVPVISFRRLIDNDFQPVTTPKARILIVKTLGESTQVYHIGLVIQGLPKLRKVTADSLVEEKTGEQHKALFSQVAVDDDQALIPELGYLTRIVERAAYGK
ncbi:MAG: chemotaxis protein CheW [Lysobacterales bacterium]|jgi:chemosensory pili system protein ChpC